MCILSWDTWTLESTPTPILEKNSPTGIRSRDSYLSLSKFSQQLGCQVMPFHYFKEGIMVNSVHYSRGVPPSPLWGIIFWYLSFRYYILNVIISICLFQTHSDICICMSRSIQFSMHNNSSIFLYYMHKRNLFHFLRWNS